MDKNTEEKKNMQPEEMTEEEKLIFDSHAEMSESIKKINAQKSAVSEEKILAERDGDGTQEFSNGRLGYAKRRAPKSNRFVKGLIIFGVSGLCLIILLLAVIWRYTEISVDGIPESRVAALAGGTDSEGWRQLLRLNLPKTYAEYENASDLAYKVLSPEFSTGKVTYLPAGSTENTVTYALFSDGDHFADVVYEKTEGFAPVFGEWEQKYILFDLSYINSVKFPVTKIIIPAGAEYTVNGVNNPAPANTVENTVYPGKNPGEENALDCCTALEFTDLYYVPVLSAKLNGTELVLHSDDEARIYWFEYPETSVHTLTVTVPAGADAYVGGRKLDESWAERASVLGELGELDDGGTGTLPALSVWTVKGLFYDTPVSAVLGGNALSLKSSENYNFVFNIPAECKYTITVICPSGSELTVNGRVAGESSKLAGGATAEELGNGHTVLGRYSVSELSAVEGAMPYFDKYVLTGYLAMPVISVKLNGTVLEAAAFSSEAYNARWEFDIPAGEAAVESSAVLSGAVSFFDAYVKYLCDGGIYYKSDKGLIYNAENAEIFNDNYNSILKMMVKGSSGYKSVMESYREVSLMNHYGAYEITDLTAGECVEYTDRCVSYVISGNVKRGDAPEVAEGAVYTGPAVVGETDSIRVTMYVLEVKSGGTWCTWGFICTTESINN